MSKFLPCLWFDDQAKEAAEFYTKVFENGQLEDTAYYVDDEHKPKGSLLTIQFSIANQTFIGLNGGPEFKFTPAISFFVECETMEQTKQLWEHLVEEGKILMPLGSYPFSEQFGWLEDRFGVSWQITFTGKEQTISPAFMFANQKFGQAETAMNEWIKIFGEGQIIENVKGSDDTVTQALFTLHGQPFRVMDSPGQHDFDFTMATSFYVYCEDQAEIDRLWEQVTKDGKEWPCGWMEDRFGVCWQVVTKDVEKYLDNSNPDRAYHVMQELYTMKKIDISRLKAVYEKYSN